jgi:hypothetical protein
MTEMIEGPEAFARFKAGVKSALSVSREELMRREEVYKRESARNPSRPGPKPKRKSKTRT